MATTKELYARYKEKMQKIADVKNATAILQWDQETYLPKKGAVIRGQQISTLSEIAHEMFSEEELGGVLQELMSRSDLEKNDRRNIELTLDDYTKNKKYTSRFVRDLSDQVNKTFHAWIESRQKNSFSFFEKDITALLELKRQEADLLGYEAHPYNALLDEFEKGCTVSLLDRIFEDLLPRLRDLTGKIAQKPQVDDSFLFKMFPKQQQWEWGMHLVKELNFNFEAGRQDLSEHPFSISFNANDVRITTRVAENDFGNMTWSCIHEVGHALYEQGLPLDQYGLPLGEACSYSIHESQSRLWENNVGRSKLFWQHYFPQLQQHFPEQFRGISLDQFYGAINKVQPSLVRTEADEITYHFHVYVRYQLEKKLLEGSQTAKEIPHFWNEQYKNLLHVTVPDDKQGCLQDVHWSHGSFGYFPTYSLGSFYAAQFFQKAKTDIRDLDDKLSNGEFAPLLEWLRINIHAKGRLHTSEELCKEVTGKALQVDNFINYLLDKYALIY